MDIFVVREDIYDQYNGKSTSVFNCATNEVAMAVIEKRKAEIKSDWEPKIDFNAGWEEEDSPGNYILHDADNEYYYEIFVYRDSVITSADDID